MKLKRLLALLGGVFCVALNSAFAQTDVTSTYLTNADFESSTPISSNLKGYGKDGTPYGFQTVEGWTSVVTNGDNSNASYPNSGMGGAVFAYGSAYQLQGNNQAVPTTNPNSGNTGKCLGFFGVWGCGGYYYQEVTLQPGAYTINIPVYNQSGTSTTTTYFGWTPDEGTASTMATPTSTGSWQTLTTSFTLEAATKGQIRVGYKSNGSGSGANPHLFIDKVQILCSPFATDDDYTALNTAISAVESKTWGFDADEYAPYNYADVIQALAEAKAIDQDANNSQSTVQALTATLNTTMTANAAEVNAIWDPSFEHNYSTSGNVQPIAWTGTSNHNNATDVRWMWNVSSNAGLAATSSSKALFTKYGVFYGQQAGYTMPLNADTYYTLSFVYGGWSDCKKDGYVTMADPSSVTLTFVPTDKLPLDVVDGNSNSSSWKKYQAFFKTNAAGDYVLGLRKKDESKQSQYVYGDFVLKTTTIAEATAYYNAVKDEVDDSYNAEANGGSEKTAFKNAIDADVNDYTVAQLMEAAANFYTLRDAFVAATPKYDLYVAEKANAERIDASITSAISAPTTAVEAENAWHTILVNEYNYVKDNFNADAAEAYGITIDKWTGTATSGGSADTPQTNSSEKWGETATTYYEQGKNGWGSTAWTLNYTKTVTLPANTYVLKVAARASQGTTATLKATIGGTTYTEALPNASAEGKGITTSGVASFSDGEFAKDGKGYGWQWRYLAFTLDAEGEVTLQIDASANSVNQWCSFGDVAVVSNVTTDALETAYNNFVMPALGFEDGQYAPYNNVEILSAYAEAKAIVEGTKEPSTQSAVDALTATLTSPSWTVNSGDVDAIFNGSFSSDVEGDWGLTGWTRTNVWGQQQTGLTGDYATAYYNQPGSLQYGNQGVYTMPLKASQLYKLTFAYRSHENNSNKGVTVSVTNGEEGLASATFPANGSTSDWKVVDAYFTTGAAGNYVLTLGNSGNTWMTGVSLVKAEESELALAANPTKYTYYQNASLNRTFSTDNYSTLVLPFALTADETSAAFKEVYELGAVEGQSIKLAEATEITATKPYLVKAKNATLSVTGKAIDPAKGVTNTVVKSTDEKTTATFVGTFSTVDLTSADANAYVVSNNTLYKVDSNVKVKAYRGYFTVETTGSVKNFVLDFGNGETTSIEALESETRDKVIYNLAGQRVQKAQKGIFIVNGKKVVIK